MFSTENVLPGVTHITDGMGVCFTLIAGTERALLFDTGYGMEDAAAFVRTLTDRPVKVLLSHGHHDHILGARWFPETWMCAEDLEEFRMRTGREQREKVRRQAKERGVRVPEDFMTAEIPEPGKLRFSGRIGPFESETEELGGRKAEVIRVPGHTPGSIVVYLPEEKLLLTGDDWNPCTWMWFPSSVSARRWRENMLELLRSLEGKWQSTAVQVLCSHQPRARAASELWEFLEYMTDERLLEAPAEDMNCPIHTHAVRKEPEGWTLVFDRDKLTE